MKECNSIFPSKDCNGTSCMFLPLLLIADADSDMFSGERLSRMSTQKSKLCSRKQCNRDCCF